MKHIPKLLAAALAMVMLYGPCTAAIAETAPDFNGGKSTWHGFTRYDFVMDDNTMAITPFERPEKEGDGIGAPENGIHRCIVVVPDQFAPGHPWSWRGCYWDHQPQAEIGLLKHGFCIAYISAGATLRPGPQWDAWYAYLTNHGLSPKPTFIGMSRGGEFSYTWATAHPDKVSCIYVDNPYVPMNLLMKLDGLATNDVPLLHVCGSLDPLLEHSSTAVENIYQQLGGRISVMIKDGFAHHPHSLPDPTPIVDFVVQSVTATNTPVPAFVGRKFVKTSFYATDNSYRYFPEEKAYITYRGPQFTPCYDRYQFNTGHFSGGGVTVIVPQNPAPGNPWVFRADYVTRDASVDLALLAKGFYIVTGPVPYDDGPIPTEWDATYQYFVDHGFSPKPVMEGDGGAAGEAFAWAMAHPDKVSCIYGENPFLHSNLSKLPLFDSLNLLANAHVPIISVCGSEDPLLADNTRVIEKRYQDLGGKIQVIIKDGQGHYPLSPQDPEPVVEFIMAAVK